MRKIEIKEEGWPSVEWSFWRANCGCGWWDDTLGKCWNCREKSLASGGWQSKWIGRQ